MPNNAFHHVGIRVSDIEKAGQFYVDALDGHWETLPGVYEPPFAGVVMGGVPDASFKVCHIGFDTGVIELFEFLEPVHPTKPDYAPQTQLLHYCIQVDDVHKALERVEAHGGKRYWPEVQEVFPGLEVIYVTDPDGNVIELITGTIDEVMDAMKADDPALDPANR